MLTLKIRLATESDAQQIQAIYEPYVLNTAISFEVAPPSIDDVRRRISETLINFPWLVCESSDGAILGYAYAGKHGLRTAYQWSVDVAIYIDSRVHRKGVGRALYTSLFSVLPTLNLATAFACITLPNEKSVGLHEAMGFTPVGVFEKIGFKHGKWLDTGWWSLLLRPYEENPEPPIPFARVSNRPEVRALIDTGNIDLNKF